MEDIRTDFPPPPGFQNLPGALMNDPRPSNRKSGRFLTAPCYSCKTPSKHQQVSDSPLVFLQNAQQASIINGGSTISNPLARGASQARADTRVYMHICLHVNAHEHHMKARNKAPSPSPRAPPPRRTSRRWCPPACACQPHRRGFAPGRQSCSAAWAVGWVDVGRGENARKRMSQSAAMLRH